LNKLIKNELFKVFHKKSIYIFGIIILLFCLLNNLLYKFTYDNEGNFINNTVYEEDYNSILNTLDPNLDMEEYLNYKTLKDISDINKNNNFSYDSWQYNISNKYLYSILYNINYYTYKEKDNYKKQEYLDEFNKLLNIIRKDDYKYFIKLELNEVEKDIKMLNKTSFTSKKDYEESLFRLNLEKEILEIRLNNNISYASSYLNDAIYNYENSKIRLYGFDKTNLTYYEKLEYQDLIYENITSKYIIDNKVNINKENNLKTGIQDLIFDYELFIMIFIIIISSSIVSSEFKNNTVKSLLTKPYTRNKILLSKYITCLISLFIIILYTFIIEVIVGSICFGIDSLNIPVLMYNYNTNSLIKHNVFIYMLITILCKVPMYILLLTLSFSISTIFRSSSLANTLTILAYLFKDIFYTIFSVFQIEFLKYFVTFNWDFTEYLYGRIPTIENLTLTISIIICLFYYLIMIIPTFIVFKKRNI